MDRVGDRFTMGRSVWEIHADRPKIAAAFRRMLAGEEFRGEVEHGGRWMVHGVPVYRDGTLIGVSGSSVCLETPPAAPDFDGCRVIEVDGDVPHLNLWDGDWLLVKDGRSWATQVRFRDVRDVAQFCFESPGRANVIREPADAAPSRPHLRLEK